MNLTDSPEAKNFIHMVDRKAQRLSVQLLFSPQQSVMSIDNREGTDGYFADPVDDAPGYIVIPVGNEQAVWLHTLAHEYVHMCQWFRDDPVWERWRKYASQANYIRLEEATEAEACKVIAEWQLPCGDAARRSRAYLRRLRKEARGK